MDEIINIGNKSFTKDEVIARGQKSINILKNVLRWLGLGIAATGLTLLLYSLFGENGPLKSSSPIETAVMMSYVLYGLMVVIGLVMFVLSFLKRDPYKYGIKALEKENRLSEEEKEKQNDELNKLIKKRQSIVKSGEMTPDKIINIKSKEETIEILTELMLFRINKNGVKSKIFTPDDILSYELTIDDELVYNSTDYKSTGNYSWSGESLGKAGGAIGKALSKIPLKKVKIIGNGVEAASGVIEGTNLEKNTEKEVHSKNAKTLHHYSFVLRLNDLKCPTYVAEDIRVEVAEEAATAISIIDSNKINKPNINETKVKTQKVPEIKQEEPKQIEEKKEEKIDKFAEIKKYKELLDEGIITQEEFDQKKKELL